MILQFTTESGSQYLIDYNVKTWARITATEDSGFLRTDEGPFIEVSQPIVGQRFLIVCPPIVEGAAARLIHTSRIKEVIALEKAA